MSRNCGPEQPEFVWFYEHVKILEAFEYDPNLALEVSRFLEANKDRYKKERFEYLEQYVRYFFVWDNLANCDHCDGKLVPPIGNCFKCGRDD